MLTKIASSLLLIFFRTKACLNVSDLSKKDHRILKAKSRLYLWNLITVAVFYSLPVIQLVFTSQKVNHILLH
jgi:flagellar biosynthesis protein FliR